MGASLFHLQNPIPRLGRLSIPHPGFIPTPSAKRNPSPPLSPSPPPRPLPLPHFLPQPHLPSKLISVTIVTLISSIPPTATRTKSQVHPDKFQAWIPPLFVPPNRYRPFNFYRCYNCNTLKFCPSAMTSAPRPRPSRGRQRLKKGFSYACYNCNTDTCLGVRSRIPLFWPGARWGGLRRGRRQ